MHKAAVSFHWWVFSPLPKKNKKSSIDFSHFACCPLLIPQHLFYNLVLIVHKCGQCSFFFFFVKMYRKIILLVLKSRYAWKPHNFIAQKEEWASLLSSAWKRGSHRLISFSDFWSFVQWKGCYFLLFFNGNMTQTCNVSVSRLLQWAASNCTTTEGSEYWDINFVYGHTHCYLPLKI